VIVFVPVTAPAIEIAELAVVNVEDAIVRAVAEAVPA
jgi:hypothetical protein